MARPLTGPPPDLDPWLPWLRERSWAVERALGPWLPVLASAVGPAAERREPDPGGEPTGWSGLTNRGPYDRLLMSEWLLAEELPDEFLRRATAGEHLFVELDRSRPNRSPWVVLLCDAGPDQLGAPRLVQLALLVVLALRRTSPERVAVGALQSEDLYEPPLDESTGRRLMKQRTARRPSRADAERWRKRLAEEGDEPPELWVVGGADTRALPLGRSNRVVVEEDWRTGSLEVAVHRADGTVARITLAEPAPEAARVLADPFGRRTVDRPYPDDVSAVYATSRWLLLRDRRGSVDVLRAVATPQGPRGGTREVATSLRPGERLLAAGRIQKGLTALWLVGDELVGEFKGVTHRMPRPERFSVADGPLEPLIGHQKTVLVADPAGRTWELDFRALVARELAGRAGPAWFLPRGEGVLWSDGVGVVVGDRRTWQRGALTASPTEVAPEPTLQHPAWFHAPGRWVGVEEGVLRSVASSDPSAALSVPLGPDPVLAGCADPDGHCYAVVTRKAVRFFHPATAELLCAWELP